LKVGDGARYVAGDGAGYGAGDGVGDGAGGGVGDGAGDGAGEGAGPLDAPKDADKAACNQQEEERTRKAEEEERTRKAEEEERTRKAEEERTRKAEEEERARKAEQKEQKRLDEGEGKGEEALAPSQGEGAGEGDKGAGEGEGAGEAKEADKPAIVHCDQAEENRPHDNPTKPSWSKSIPCVNAEKFIVRTLENTDGDHLIESARVVFDKLLEVRVPSGVTIPRALIVLMRYRRMLKSKRDSMKPLGRR
jgi:hypothetical protein